MDTFTLGLIAILVFAISLNRFRKLQRYADIESKPACQIMEGVGYNMVYGIVGDSPIPLLALVEGIECSSFTFFYTPEKAQKVSTLEPYFQSQYQDMSVVFDEIPSMNDPSAQVLAIRERLEDSRRDETFGPVDSVSAVFVTAGTSTMALSLWHHSGCRDWISLRKGLKLQIWDPSGTTESTTIPVDGSKFTLQQILKSCGWIYDGGRLRRKDGKESEKIKVDYDPKSGELSFIAIIPSNETDKYGEKTVSFMSALVHEFGHNGAIYEIKGELSRRALNLMHNSINHIKS